MCGKTGRNGTPRCIGRIPWSWMSLTAIAMESYVVSSGCDGGGGSLLPPRLPWTDPRGSVAGGCDSRGATSRRRGGGAAGYRPWRWAVLPSREWCGPRYPRVIRVILAVSVGARGGALPVFASYRPSTDPRRLTSCGFRRSTTSPHAKAPLREAVGGGRPWRRPCSQQLQP